MQRCFPTHRVIPATAGTSVLGRAVNALNMASRFRGNDPVGIYPIGAGDSR